MTKDTIGLAEAAQRLRLPYQAAHRLVLLGRLGAVKRAGRWQVWLADVVRLAGQQGENSTRKEKEDE